MDSCEQRLRRTKKVRQKTGEIALHQTERDINQNEDHNKKKKKITGRGS